MKLSRWITLGVLLLVIIGWQATAVRPGEIEIASGDSISTVAENLRQAKIIRSAWALRLGLKIFGQADHVFPGQVVVPNGCSLRCLVQQLTAANERSVRLTIIEGMDLRDIGNLLELNGLAQREELHELVGFPAVRPTGRQDWCAEFSFLCAVPKNISYEGYLFPDTYDLGATSGAADLVRRMLLNFDKKFTPERRALAEQRYGSVSAALTVASILEKEVRSVADKKIVADLIARRLQRGMALQMDATVQYVTGKSNRYTTAADRATASPWNTYRYPGLPVGPICNPGLESIDAALHPTPNNYWFYLTAPDGTAHFARTLEEHVANKKYLR